MLKKILLIVAICSFSFSQAAFACSAAGDNKHVGTVTSVDEQSKTFTIMDMEQQKPITFSAADNILEKASSASSVITVTFEEKDGQITAIEIES